MRNRSLGGYGAHIPWRSLTDCAKQVLLVYILVDTNPLSRPSQLRPAIRAISSDVVARVLELGSVLEAAGAKQRIPETIFEGRGGRWLVVYRTLRNGRKITAGGL